VARANCRSNQILNPETGRCVKRNGAIGKRILEQNRQPDEVKEHIDEQYKHKWPMRALKFLPLDKLRKYCRYHNILGCSQMNKNQILDFIESNYPEEIISDEEIQRQREEERKQEEEVKVGDAVPYPEINLPNVNLNNSVERKYGKQIIGAIANLNKIPPNQIVFLKRLGSGAYGDIYVVRIINKKVIIKIEEYGQRNGKKIEDIYREYNTHVQFYQHKVGVPKPYYVGHYREENTNRQISFTAMKLDSYAIDFGLFETQLNERIPQYILDYMLQSIDAILGHFCKHHLIHGDFHWGNIGFQDIHSQSQTVLTQFPVRINTNNREYVYYISPLVIDFGFAETNVRCKPHLELIQLIRTLYPQYTRSIPENRNYIYNGLLNLIDKYCEPRILNRNMLPLRPTWSERESNISDKLFDEFRK
jgi:hypothetical protein